MKINKEDFALGFTAGIMFAFVFLIIVKLVTG